MHKKFLMMPVILGFMVFGSTSLMAETAIQEIAEVLLHLNHHPSDSEIIELKKIAGDSAASENERAIAAALMNMEHRVGAADKEKLRKIANDNSAPMADRKIASILADLNHKPSASDKEELEKLK